MKSTRHEAIANDLTRNILSGRYQPGDRLPSERDLAARFDVNRGAVREALKTLEQLGIIDVQPGGARVAPVEEASADVIGKLLEIDDLPDPDLVVQVMQVMGALFKLAAQTAIELATDEQIDNLIARSRRLRKSVEDGEEDIVARMELGRAFMEASGNLVSRIIARGLWAQLRSRIIGIVEYQENYAPERYAACFAGLETALKDRDRVRLRDSLDAMWELNRESMLRVLARAAEQRPPREAATT